MEKKHIDWTHTRVYKNFEDMPYRLCVCDKNAKPNADNVVCEKAVRGDFELVRDRFDFIVQACNNYYLLLETLQKIEIWSRDSNNGSLDAVNDKAKQALSQIN